MNLNTKSSIMAWTLMIGYLSVWNLAFKGLLDIHNSALEDSANKYQNLLELSCSYIFFFGGYREYYEILV